MLLAALGLVVAAVISYSLGRLPRVLLTAGQIKKFREIELRIWAGRKVGEGEQAPQSEGPSFLALPLALEPAERAAEDETAAKAEQEQESTRPHLEREGEPEVDPDNFVT